MQVIGVALHQNGRSARRLAAMGRPVEAQAALSLMGAADGSIMATAAVTGLLNWRILTLKALQEIAAGAANAPAP